MSVEKIERLKDKTIFYVHEPTRYGEPDRDSIATVPHDPKYGARLPKITQKKVDEHKDVSGHVIPDAVEIYDVPEVGKVVFIDVFDEDYCSSMYRSGAHDTRGPYLLE